jgi:hypothetical protein
MGKRPSRVVEGSESRLQRTKPATADKNRLALNVRVIDLVRSLRIARQTTLANQPYCMNEYGRLTRVIMRANEPEPAAQQAIQTIPSRRNTSTSAAEIPRLCSTSAVCSPSSGTCGGISSPCRPDILMADPRTLMSP